MKKFKFQAAGKVLAAGVLTLAVAFLLAPITWAQGNYKVLHSFEGTPNAGEPSGGVIFDASGNLYGMTTGGGGPDCTQYNGCGTVYMLGFNSDGSWTESVLHSFTGKADGGTPWVTSLTFDQVGNLVGSTFWGGERGCAANHGCGTLFMLSPTGDGDWTETVLHSFSGSKDGANPAGDVMFDTAGNLFGTTELGGAYGDGVAFAATPSDGKWADRVLHAFTGGKDGAQVVSGFTMDGQGNLYGTARSGGNYGAGVVFRATPTPTGWSKTVIYEFRGGSDGSTPQGDLTIGSDGNLYGMTRAGGSSCDCGTVFRLTQQLSGSWTKEILHTFNGNDGSTPWAGVVTDSEGNLYGTTYYGGTGPSGVVFELTQNIDGTWTETVLHNFSGAEDGGNSQAAVTLDPQGDIYGTTRYGGAYGHGVVFEITP